MAKGEPQYSEGNRSEVVSATLGSRKKGAKETFPAIGKNSGRLRELMAGALAGMVALAGCKPMSQPDVPEQSQVVASTNTIQNSTTQEVISPWKDPSTKKSENNSKNDGPYTQAELSQAQAAMQKAIKKPKIVKGVENPWPKTSTPGKPQVTIPTNNPQKEDMLPFGKEE